MTPSLSIERVGPQCNEIMVNLFEHYLHDMSQWFDIDVRNDGRYAYDMTPHWQSGEPVYLLRANGALAGFAIVGSAQRWTNDAATHDVREFFVLRRYRRCGCGAALARKIWTNHPGAWLVRVLEANTAAVAFWRKVITAYSDGRCSERNVVPDSKRRIFFSFHNGSS